MPGWVPAVATLKSESVINLKDLSPVCLRVHAHTLIRDLFIHLAGTYMDYHISFQF